MRLKSIFFFMALCLSFSDVCLASDVIEIPMGFDQSLRKEGSLLPYHTASRPRITVALSGGGARGLAHIGVLQVLESNGIMIDGIAGTSMGAVIGGLYAAGYSATELERIALQINWSDLIQDRPPRRELFLSQKAQSARSLLEMRFQGWAPVLRSSITGGHKLNTLLTDLIYKAPQPIYSDFDHLKMPLRIVATDLLTGQKVVLSGGSMVDAMQGSMAIPLMFAPVSYAPWYLADGGLVQNLPVEEARIFKPDLVIAVDTSSKLRSKNDIKLPWQMADQVTTIMHKHILESQLESADLVIQPDLVEISNSDFDRLEHIIQAGRTAAENQLREIETHLLDLDVPLKVDGYVISGFEFSGLDQIPLETIKGLIQLDLNKPATQQEIRWAGQMLYQSGWFQTITALLDTVSRLLTFQCLENPVIDQIEIRGNTFISNEEILSLIKWSPGEVMNHSCARDCHSAIIRHYQEKGYSLFRIVDTIITGRKMTITVDEGRIHAIEFRGNTRTRSSIIERDLSLKPGNLFNIQEIAQSLDNLYSTGLFDDIRFDIQGESDKRTLLLTFMEKPYHLIRFGLRYDMERQTKGFFELVEENVLGLGGQGSLTALYGSWDKMAQMQIRSDRLFNSFWTIEVNSGIEERRYRYYEDYKQKSLYRLSSGFASFAIGQQMQKLGTLWAQLNLEKYKTSPYEGESAPAENNMLTLLSLRSIVDTRDAMPFPKTGKYYVLEYQSSLSFLGSEVPYFRLYSSMSSYYTVAKRFVFMPRLRWGTSDLTIPFIKQFRLGGLDSFYGLPENGAVGKRFIAMNTMLRYQIPWTPWFNQYISIRYDLGGIWARYSKIASSDFIHGGGLIWSAGTPAGPVYIGWGRLSTGQTQWYFSLGYQFD